MKILWLNANLLLPLDKGGKLRTWHVMRHLAAHHEITYLSFCDPAQPRADHEGMGEVCADLHTIPRTDPAKGTARFYADAARYLVDPVPYGVAKYRSEAFRSTVDRLFRERRFDAVVCDFLVPVVNMPDRLPCPGILFTHNVEAEIWRRHAENARNPVSRFLLGQQWRRMLRFERTALGRFDLVLAVSEADRDTFQRLYPDTLRTPAHVVQTGVDTAYFAPAAAPERRAHLVFTGSMDWLPNEDGMQYFVRDILPRIRQVEPDATLSIIGRSPTPAVKRLADDAGIEVTGRVDDVRPHIAAGAVYVGAASHRRRDATEDFRSDGDGKSRGLHHCRRRRAAGHTGPEHRHRRRAGPFRAGRGAHDSRRRRTPEDRDRGQAHCRRTL